ncbi:capsule biosynthesis protein [Candidatus Viadribacter manganicus]|uniref:Capsule biosynthesis protein n=1 Tax=Candidatus Viadribacter manganicus TaxID=1759059 RepID=A0A1B1AND0_9PROT|nr:capsule biosynthesis protein [Candidatus Viadribacter manganicus]
MKPPPKLPGAAAPYSPHPNFFDWPSLIARDKALWECAVANADGPLVLIGSNTGMHGAVITMDSVLGAALTLRGARVHYMLCDGVLQGCLMANYAESTPPKLIVERGLFGALCKACFNRGTNLYRPLGLPVQRLSDFLEPADYAAVEAEVAAMSSDELGAWAPGGAAIGEHAQAGALRYFACGDLQNEPLGGAVLRRYLEGAALAARAYQRLIAREKPDVAVLHHGIYSPQGVVADILRRAGSRIATWVVAYRKHCFIFSHDDTYHHTLISEPTPTWETLALTDAQKAEVQEYLASRAGGARDWIYFHREPDTGFTEFAQSHGIDLQKPLVTALTNVMWDAQLHYPMNVFAGMKEWLVETVRWFAGRPDIQLLIRVHPAEARGAIVSRQRVIDELTAEFPQLPANVFLAGPEEDVSTYAACAASDAAIIYGTKMGVELATLGMHCIVAGEAWIRGKGLTHDAQSKPHYFELLAKLPYGESMPRPDRERALRYAYHFFFRRMMPLPFLEPNGRGSMFDIAIASLADLAPGKHPGLDAICHGIMTGAPFVYEAERFG